MNATRHRTAMGRLLGALALVLATSGCQPDIVGKAA
jgi:hypothetical protein